MEIDHLFVFIQPDGPEIQALQSLGLRETYRRKHVGQGTENVCFAFDNLYLELLWLTSEQEATSDAIRRTQLFERSRWRTLGSCPFGIAWRDGSDEERKHLETWRYQPPYLPPTLAIEVATDSDDAAQPMMFTFPGSVSPQSWPPERRGTLQHEGNLAAVSALELTQPAAPGRALRAIARHASPAFTLVQGPEHGLSLTIEALDGRGQQRLWLPGCRLEDVASMA